MSYRERFDPFTIDQRAFELRRKEQRVRISTSLLKLLVPAWRAMHVEPIQALRIE